MCPVKAASDSARSLGSGGRGASSCAFAGCVGGGVARWVINSTSKASTKNHGPCMYPHRHSGIRAIVFEILEV